MIKGSYHPENITIITYMHQTSELLKYEANIDRIEGRNRDRSSIIEGFKVPLSTMDTTR